MHACVDAYDLFSLYLRGCYPLMLNDLTLNKFSLFFYYWDKISNYQGREIWTILVKGDQFVLENKGGKKDMSVGGEEEVRGGVEGEE